MDGPFAEILNRLPLAEGVLWLWRWITRDERLESLWRIHRGRCYDKAISFPLMVQLVSDAVMRFDGSGRRSFDHAIENETLEASTPAAYRKLGRLPIPVSEALLTQTTADLREVFPSLVKRLLPTSLASMNLILLDGKTIKHVAKRLLPLRGVAGGLVGGKALVAQEWSTGLAVAMQADPDGDRNEIGMIEAILPHVRAAVPGPRVWTADRAFSTPLQMSRFTAEGDHFVLRYSRTTSFAADKSRKKRFGRDEQGRAYVEDWGWLGGENHPQRCLVRRIRLRRTSNPKDDLVLVTDLLDADQYPATDLLEIYAERWSIEHMFQDVTEVFGLKRLIGGTPQACLFQLSFCLVLYNMIEVVRGYVAQGRGKSVDELSDEKLFEDIEEQLIAWNVVLDMSTTLEHFREVPTASAMRVLLKTLLSRPWSERWLKTTAQAKRRPQNHGRTRTHHSTYRILQSLGHGRLKANGSRRKQAAVT
jgi:hypothetical protein